MNQIVVLNAGGQYCHLIARRIRELGVHAVVADINRPASDFDGVRGIIISGGPASVTEATSPKVDRRIYELGIPVLGICYGHQLMANDLAGGQVTRGTIKEYGHSSLTRAKSVVFKGIPDRSITVWMSHGDTVTKAPDGFATIGRTDDCQIAAMEHGARKLFGLQFHPEVVHTEFGTEIYRNFVFDVCGCTKDWDPRARVEQVMDEIRAKAAGRKVFFLISGGVDSTVAFYCCYRALGPGRVLGLYVDTGFMREGDADAIDHLVREAGRDAIHIADRSRDFFARLAGETNPERKRPDHRRDVPRRSGGRVRAPGAARRRVAPGPGHDLSRHHRVRRRQPLGQDQDPPQSGGADPEADRAGQGHRAAGRALQGRGARARRAARAAARGGVAPSVPGPRPGRPVSGR